MTMVPDMVVADNISAFKKTGSVPKTAITAIDNLPKVKSFDRPKSTANNFENDEKADRSGPGVQVIRHRTGG